MLLMQENEAWASLLAEISSEAGQVAQFLIDREIEAPERYSAVQSYRVAMAVLRQQRLFVEVSNACGATACWPCCCGGCMRGWCCCC
jgi:hypothetical protein